MELVKRLRRFPKETIEYLSKYDGKARKFTREGVLKVIATSFYEKGEPVESTFIAKKLGLAKAEKFAYKVLQRWLGTMVNYINRREGGGKGRGFATPSALIFVSEDGEVLDLTEFSEFHENLDRFSQKVALNILKEPINLREFLLSFEGREKDAVKRLRELCKLATFSLGKYELADLKEYVSRGFFLEDMSQRTKDSRYKFRGLPPFEFILWYGTGRKGDEFFHDDVISKYVKRGVWLPDEIREVKKRILKRKKKEAKTKGQVFDNHPGYKLLKIEMRREIRKAERKQKIYLTFGPTDFYTSVATNQSLDEPILKSEKGFTTIRRKYIKEMDLNEPNYLENSFLSNMFGVALATITEDGKIILQRRSQRVYMGPEKLTLATAENMIRGLDEDKDGRPNPFITVKRCIKEELGEEIDLEDVTFLGFGVRLDNLLPQALGMVKLRSKSSDISFVKARDRWEGKNFLEDFTINALKKYFRERYLISDTAKLTILLALIHEYGVKDVERGFRPRPAPNQL